MTPAVGCLPYRALLPRGVALLAVATAAVYAVAFDQGLLQLAFSDALLSRGGVLHELFHDGRHLLGVPCH